MQEIDFMFVKRPPAREAQVIKGICRQIDWYVGKRLEELKK
jgi:hypothetical protein